MKLYMYPVKLIKIGKCLLALCKIIWVMTAKFNALKTSADNIGMVINPGKSKYLCISGNDSEPFQANDVIVSHTKDYMYLGTPVSSDPIAKQVKAHLKMKAGHTLKFHSFLAKNCEAPFAVKKTVWNSALKAAIFYSCETWLTSDLKAAESVFNMTLKNLLGVRATTCNDLIFTESGEFGAKVYIRQQQLTFLNKLMARADYSGSYLETTIKLAQETRCPAGLVLADILHHGPGYSTKCQADILNAVRSSDSTRRSSYRILNPDLDVSPVYGGIVIPECNRIAFTRMRLGSHHLRYETGRWARIPAHERMCSCGAVQTEKHVLLECEITREARESHTIPDCNITNIFKVVPADRMASYCNNILRNERLQ